MTTTGTSTRFAKSLELHEAALKSKCPDCGGNCDAILKAMKRARMDGTLFHSAGRLVRIAKKAGRR